MAPLQPCQLSARAGSARPSNYACRPTKNSAAGSCQCPLDGTCHECSATRRHRRKRNARITWRGNSSPEFWMFLILLVVLLVVVVPWMIGQLKACLLSGRMSKIATIAKNQRKVHERSHRTHSGMTHEHRAERADPCNGCCDDHLNPGWVHGGRLYLPRQERQTVFKRTGVTVGRTVLQASDSDRFASVRDTAQTRRRRQRLRATASRRRHRQRRSGVDCYPAWTEGS
jgi:hypothetical protein